MRRIVLIILFLAVQFVANSEDLVNKPFNKQDDIKGIFGIKNKELVKVVKASDGAAALEITVPEGAATSNNLMSIQLSGKDIRGATLNFEVEIKCELSKALNGGGRGKLGHCGRVN